MDRVPSCCASAGRCWAIRPRAKGVESGAAVGGLGCYCCCYCPSNWGSVHFARGVKVSCQKIQPTDEVQSSKGITSVGDGWKGSDMDRL